MGFFEDRDDVGPPPQPFRIGGEGGFRSPIGLRWIGLGAAILILFILANVAKTLFVDWLWFDSVDKGDVFKRIVVAKVSLFAAGAVISGVVIGLNIWLARHFAPKGVEESFIEEVDPQAIRRIVTVALVAGTLFLAVIFGATAGGAWETVLSWLNGVAFDVKEPAFNRDISFYLFDLPAYHLFQRWVLWLLVVSTAGAGAVYGLVLALQQFELNITRGMRIHLSVLLGLILLVVAMGTYLGIFDLATAAGGLVAGATYADINARVPVRWVLTGMVAVASITVIANAFLFSGYRLPIFTLSLWAITGVVGGAIYPSIVQRTVVDPNQLDKERQFIERNITMTQLAFGLDRIVDTDFPVAPAVTSAEIADITNAATIANIRLLDTRPARDTFNQIQSIRPLYFFNDVDVDRYMINGKLTQVMISARELDIRRAPDRNWTNDRLKRTHGFGAVIAPVNEISEQGLPVLLTQDIPPVGEEIPISEEGSRIYFGELTNHWVIVNTSEPEFDYPVGTDFAEAPAYSVGGIRLSSFMRRFMLAWDLGDTNLLISGRIGSGSRLLMNRSLQDRIEKVAPFLVLDPDPYLVADNGQLLWIQDAYTTSGYFPYSQPAGTVNYIRNSVKVTVDARTGDMSFYLVDEDDPIAATWGNIFPDLFTAFDEMPDSIRAHLRYPEFLFRLQAELYLSYHIDDPDVFFLKEDFWNIPTEKFRQQEQQLDPYYVIMTLPGETQEEFVMILPFTPRNKTNTVAWLAGRSDGEFRGDLRSYRFPTDRLVFGPAQIESKIDQDTGISQQLTLWDQAGSEVIRGNLLMIPIGNSFLYVEPIYLQAETGRFPELKRVVVANGNEQTFNIAMEKTFELSLDVVFGRRASTLPGATTIPKMQAPAPATPTLAAGAGTAPTGDLDALLGQAEAATDAVEIDLNRLRDIIEAIRQQQAQ